MQRDETHRLSNTLASRIPNISIHIATRRRDDHLQNRVEMIIYPVLFFFFSKLQNRASRILFNPAFDECASPVEFIEEVQVSRSRVSRFSRLALLGRICSVVEEVRVGFGPCVNTRYANREV